MAASLAALAFIACVLIWGSTWLAIKVGYEGVGALTGAALRFGLAAVMLAGIALATRRSLRLRGRDLRLALFVAASTFVLDYGLIYWAEQALTSGLTAVLFATLPFSTGLFAWLLLREAPTARKLGGAALGLLGLAVLFGDSLRLDAALLVPMLAVLAATVLASASGVAMKKWGRDVDNVALFAVAMGAGSAGLFAWAFAAGERIALPSTAIAWASVAYLAVFGSVVGFLLYYWLLRTHDVVKLSLVAILIPLVALALGAATLGETLGLAQLAGVALVLVGVAITLTAPAQRPRSAAEGAEPA